MWRWCCRWLPAVAMGDMTHILISLNAVLPLGDECAVLQNTATRPRMRWIRLCRSTRIAPLRGRPEGVGGEPPFRSTRIAPLRGRPSGRRGWASLARVSVYGGGR